MLLTKKLILFKYILKQFGYDDFETLRERYNNAKTGYDETDRSFYAGSLIAAPKSIDDTTLLEYDNAIREYEERLRTNRGEPLLTFKYFQWFALLFTEYYLDRLTTDSDKLLFDLKEFKNENEELTDIPDYEEDDLKKLAYWMATGSGKTLIMHCNYWQFQKYFKEWENIVLITPNEGLSQQHYESFQASGIDARRYSGSEESLKGKDGEVLIIEITKLVKEKEGEGVSVDVDYFSETKNLVFIDEGHKGQRSEEKKWKSLREHITRGNDSVTVEYSATFGQIIGTSTKDLLYEYSRSILFDYSYRHFYADGYGKDFSVFNIEAVDEYNEEQTDLLLTGGLLSYYEQLVLFEKYDKELREYEIEKPLWIFVGSKVLGKNVSKSLNKTEQQSVSDVTRVIKYFQKILANPSKLEEQISKILNNNSGLINSDGDDIFLEKFNYLRRNKPDVDDIITRLFNGSGTIEAYNIKQAEGEIGLKTKTSDKYFAVINIGDVSKYSKKLEEDTDGEIVIQDDNFMNSLFQNLSESNSTVNILIGSKKFIEGWNSWRVSCMGLLNMGKNEGTQILQLFGRGVRLKGKNLSLKRESELAKYHIRALQTISIFGLNASYMNNFLRNIEKETPEYKEYPVEIKFNRQSEWEGKILTLKKDEEHNFKDHLIVLEYVEDIADRIKIDLRNKVMVAVSGFNNQIAENREEYKGNLLKEFFDFIDIEDLVDEAKRYCLLKGFTNLIVDRNAVINVIKNLKSNSILTQKGQFGIEAGINGRIQKIAETVVKDYIGKYYSDKEKDSLTKNLSVDMLDYDKYPDVFPENKKMIIKAPKEYQKIVDELMEDINQFYRDDVKEVATIHFDRHLYSPLAVYRKARRAKEVKTVPVRLNEGETKFIEDLKNYVHRHIDKFKDTEIFLLRNLSQKGVGFFLESSTFFPDFILWVVKGNKQYVFFLDPKGIRMMGNFNDPKIIFCKTQVKEIDKAIKQKLKNEYQDLQAEIDAYILSVSKYDDIKKQWGAEQPEISEFKENKILFIAEDDKYLGDLLGG